MPLIPLHQTLPDRNGAARHTIGDIEALDDTLQALTLQVPASNGWSGPWIDTLAVAAGVVEFDLVMLSAIGNWQRADATQAATASGLLALAIDGGVGLPAGIARHAGWSFTPGAALYVAATPGAISEEAPSGASDRVVRCIGYALSANALYFLPSIPIVLL